MRKLKDDYTPKPVQVSTITNGYKPFSDRVSDHFKPTATGQRIDQLIAYFSQLQGELVDAEWVVKFCVDQIYKDTHASFNGGRCRVFSRI